MTRKPLAERSVSGFFMVYRLDFALCYPPYAISVLSPPA